MIFPADVDTPGWLPTKQGVAMAHEEVQQLISNIVTLVTNALPDSLERYERTFILECAKEIGEEALKMAEVFE